MAVNWNARSYSKEEFIQAWQSASHVADCARRLNLTIFGATYQVLRDAALELGLNEDHMVGDYWREPRTKSRRVIPIADRLVANSTYDRGALKDLLFKEKLKDKRCESCGLENWCGASIPLQLDHANGDRRDNRLENLKILCANCHAQTPTFAGRNKNKNYPNRKSNTNKCVDCNKEIDPRSTRCKSCASIDTSQEIAWPPVEELLDRLKTTSYRALAEELGVSDNGIRKHFKNRGLVPPKGRNRNSA